MNDISYWLYNCLIDDIDMSDAKNIIMYHLSRLHFDEKSVNVEFNILTPVNNTIYPIFKKDGDDKIIHPVLSCIVFLTDCEFPFIITNIDMDKYRYKEFKNEDSVNIFFPKKNTHIIFNGNMCNGFIIPKSNNECKTRSILINVWDKNVERNCENDIKNEENLSKENPTKEKKIMEISPLYVTKLIWNNSLMNYNMYNKLLYMKKYTYEELNPIFELYNKDNSHNWYIIEKNKINLKNIFTKNNKEIEMNTKNRNSRFLQRFTIKQMLSSNTCNWLIEICQKDDTIWKINENELSLPKKYIDMMENNEMNSFTIKMLEAICDEVNKSYNINIQKSKIEISRVLLGKYEKNAFHDNLIMKADINHDISCEIMMSKNDDNNNNEGQLLFDDGLDVILNQGDMVIYSNLISHNISEISNQNISVYKIIIHMKINED
jgi:hypothetical protein